MIRDMEGIHCSDGEVMNKCNLINTWGSSAVEIYSDIGGRVTALSGATASLKQRLSMAIQKGNAAAVLGTSPLWDNSCL